MTEISEKVIKEAFDDALDEDRRLTFPKLYELEEGLYVSVIYESDGLQEVTCQKCNENNLKIYSFSRSEPNGGSGVLTSYKMAYCPNCGTGYVITRDSLSEKLLQERMEKNPG